MKKRKTEVITFALIISLFLQIFSPAYAAYVPEDETQFVLTLDCSDENVDLSDIAIDVYTASLAYAEDESGYYEFEETLSFSVAPNADGTVVFTRPSEYFSLTVQTNSLPEGYGVSEHTKFFFPEDAEYGVKISEICFADVELSQANALVPKLYDADGNIVYANASFEVLDKKEEYTIDLADCMISHDQTIEITASNKEYVIEKTLTYKYFDEIDKENYLYSNGLETQEDYIANLNQILSNRKSLTYDIQEEYFDWLEEMLLWNNMSSTTGCCVEDTASPFATETTDWITDTKFGCNASVNEGRLVVYYNSNNITEAVATAVLNTFVDADDLFCEQWGMPEPATVNAGVLSPYMVYLGRDGNYGTTYYSGNYSYILIDEDIANRIYSEGTSGEATGVVAHEYMHAIMHEYGVRSDKVNGIWMHESFATWAGARFNSEYAETRDFRVKKYFSTPWLSLTYFGDSGTTLSDRHYGTCVFPMYIYNRMGVSAIDKIYRACARSNNVLDGIASGLNDAGYSLTDAYIGSTVANWTIKDTYDLWGQPNCGKISTYPASSDQETLEPLGCTYTKFSVSSGQTATLTVTINFSLLNDSAVRTIRTTASQSNVTASPSITTGRCTVVCNNLGGNTATEFVVIAINTSTTNSDTYVATASISH